MLGDDAVGKAHRVEQLKPLTRAAVSDFGLTKTEGRRGKGAR